MNYKIFIIPLLLFLLTVTCYQFKSTTAYFTDTVSVSGNTFTMGVWTTPTTTPTPITTHLVINEVYYDVVSNKGSATDNEWIEIYNPTNEAIDISEWEIGDNQGSSYQRTIPTSPLIPARGYVVITPNSSTWSYWPEIPPTAIKIVLGNSIGNGLANDNDRVILKNPAGVEIDAMSYGNDTYAFNPACPDITTGHSLERNPAGKDTNTALDFINRSDPTPGS